MDFGKALIVLKNHGKIKRTIWDDDVYLIIEDKSVVQHNGVYASQWEYTEPTDDILADDWEIVEDIPAKPDCKEIHKIISQLCEK